MSAILLTLPLYSQDVRGGLVSGYNQAQIGNHTIQWTVGELVTQTFQVNNLTLGSGLSQQVAIITAIEDKPENGFTTFPNPFRSSLTLQSRTSIVNDRNITLTNSLGVPQFVSITSIDPNELKIHTEHLPSGVYFLTIKLPNQRPINFKVIRE